MPESSRNTGSFDAITGKYFSSPSADEAILQVEFAKQLNPQPASLVGKEVTLRYAQRQENPPADAGKPKDIDDEMDDLLSGGGISIVSHDKKLRIVGIINTDPSAGVGGFGGGRVFIPLKTAQEMRPAQGGDVGEFVRAGGSTKPTYIALTVRVKNPKYVTEVEDAIKKMGFSTFSLLDVSTSLRTVFKVFDTFLGLFGSLALTVASLGIINTLVMAILERRREIGVLKALGASDRDVRSLFFVEAGAMGFFGGICGVAIGWLISEALNFGTMIYLKREDIAAVQISYVTWWLAALAIAVSIGISLIAGLYPAARAAKLDPVEALRYE